MAPERVLGDPEGPEGDVYALGCVLIELLRGKAFGRSALLPDQQTAQVTAATDEIRERLEKLLDLVIDAGGCGSEMTTVINLTGAQPELVRAGQGPLEPFGLE